MNVSAVVSDLDGTLWAKDTSVHEATHNAIAALDEAGLPLLIATGRRGLGALKGLRPAGLANRPGILMNGALARDDLEGEAFLRETISTTDSNSVLAAFADQGLEPLMYVDHPTQDMVVGSAPGAGADYLDRAPGVRRVSELPAAIEDSHVIGFGAFGYSRDLLQPITDAINENGWATAILGVSMFEGDHGLMVQGAGVDKQTAIQAWCDRHEIDPTQLAVLGDGANDVDMLTAAKFAIVPNNAGEEIRSLATHQIEPAEAGGWAALPEILGLT